MNYTRTFIAMALLFLNHRAQGYTDADFEALKKMLAVTAAKVVELSRQNEAQNKSIQDLTKSFNEFSQKYAQLSQQKDQLAFERNVLGSAVTFKESSVAGV